MRMQPRCVFVWGVLLGLVLRALPADAARVHFGQPGGTQVAYTWSPAAPTWARQKAADLPDVGYYAAPAFADLDDDGDRDALAGEKTGRVLVYQNSGSDAAPTWIRHPGWDPGYDVGDRAAPALADLDGDGDFDLLVGNTVGVIAGFENVGSARAPAWRPRPTWNLTDLGGDVHPALGDIDRDGRPDLLVGREQGDVLAYAGSAGTWPFTRRAEWDPPGGDRVAPGLGDLDGDGRLDLLVSDGRAVTKGYRFTGGGWSVVAAWTPPDPGSGPAVPAIVPGGFGGLPATPAPVATATPMPPTAIPTGAATAGVPPATATPQPTATAAGGNHPPIARLGASPVSGAPPLAVRFDAGASSDPEGTALRFAWDFGDGTTAGGAPPADPAAAIIAGATAYEAAKATRDAGEFAAAVAAYLDVAELLMSLTTVTSAGPITVGGTSRIDRVARWYLQRTAHDLGAVHYHRDLGYPPCERYGLALNHSRESATQAIAGGFPQQPELNGTNANIALALAKLADLGCAVPAPVAMFPAPSGTAARVDHTYTTAGTYVATVTVSDGVRAATAARTITVGTTPPPPPGGGGDGNADPLQGFGAATPGGSGGRVIRVTEATDAAVRAAIKAANAGRAIVVFEVTGPITLEKELILSGAFVTIEGNGVTLLGHKLGWQPILEITGHDVIVRNMRLRNGSDNLRAQGNGAYNVVFSHISSTGARDDGLSIAYGAHDVTVQHSFFAGNTRSIFIKYGTTTNVSVHHTWIMKQWARGPLVSGSAIVDLRNLVVEDWTSWGTRLESTASGNLVHSLFTQSSFARSLGGAPNSALRLTSKGAVFTAGNVYDGVALDGPDGKAPAPIAAPPVTTLPVGEMEAVVRARAGCLPRDALDAKYIATKTGWKVGAETALRLTLP